MKILKVHNYYQQRGGEDFTFEAENRLLRECGDEVIEYVRHNDDVDGLSKAELARQTWWSQRTYDEILSIVRERRPDVIHAHNTFPLISPSIYDAAREAGVPIVQSLSNYRPLCLGATFSRDNQECYQCLGKRWGWPGVVHRCYRGNLGASLVTAKLLRDNWRRNVWTERVDRFVVLSTKAREIYAANGFPDEKLFLKPHFLQTSAKPVERYEPVAVFVGRLAEEKGLDLLFDAWGRMPAEFRLRIIGDGPLENEVRRQAEADSRIEYLGRLSHADMLDQVARSAVLVFPSRWHETFGRTLVEALAVGVPVIGSNLGGSMDIIEPGVNGWRFEAHSSESLGDVLLEFWGERSRWDDWRQRARETYESRYTPEKNYAMMQRLYGELLPGVGDGQAIAEVGV